MITAFMLLEETDGTITMWVWSSKWWPIYEAYQDSETAYYAIKDVARLLVGWGAYVDGFYTMKPE